MSTNMKNNGRTSRYQQVRTMRKRRHAFGVSGSVAALLVALIVLTLGEAKASHQLGSAIETSTISGPPGAEGVPLEEGTVLASAGSASSGTTVDGIACNTSEQVAYHVHTHLSVYVNGKLRPIPAGIGIVSPVAEQTADGPFYSASRCYYWLHVHTQDGVIHIESPTRRLYTLGNFFDIWKQPLSATKIASVKGKLTVFVNNRRYDRNPRNIELGSHVNIQIDVGTPLVAPKIVNWAKTQL